MAISYPRTGFTWFDQSQISEINNVTVSQPNYLLAFSADKGPEAIMKCTYENFHKYYGDNISFAKHGQPLLQAAVATDNGGIVFCKRVVAENSTLANIAVFASVTAGTQEQKTDEKGNKLFTHVETGNTVTESQKEALLAAAKENNETTPTFENIMVTPAVIKYETKSFADCKTINEIKVKVAALKTEEKFPLFVITDIGRGLSGKSFSITPDYIVSKTRGYMRYQLNTIEGSKVVESINICLNHNISENGINRSLYTACKQDSYNLAADVFYNYHDEFIAKLAQMSGNTDKYCNTHDLLFGFTVRQAKLNNIKIATDSVNLSSIYGVSLAEGSNGNFSEAPFGTEEFTTEVTKFYSGEIDDNIYDLDNYKFDLFLDANYPPTAKRAMESLASFREDCECMMDCGIEGLNTLEEIKVSSDGVTKSPFVMNYPIYYDIIDPYSGKQITVTAMYTMAKLMIPHFANSARFKPMAGELNGFIINDALDGTENFVPKNLPSGSQKEVLAEARINHLGKYNGILCFESLWTTQDAYSQLSFGNNVLAIQEVVKAIRDFCPANRFSIMYNDDLQAYKEDVTDIISNFKDNFVSIDMVYSADADYEANKIYGAALSFVCKDFNMAEEFKIYVL